MTRFPRSARAAFALLGLLAAGACAARNAASGDPFQQSGPLEGEVLLTVDNQDFRDATIYADWIGVRQRIGTVTGKTTETLRMEWRDHQVRLAVDFLGGGEMKLADPIAVLPGEHIDFTIMPGW